MRRLALVLIYTPCLVVDRLFGLIDIIDSHIDAKISERIDAYLEGETALLIEEVLHDG